MKTDKKASRNLVGLLIVLGIFVPESLRAQSKKKPRVPAYKLWREDLQQIGRDLPKRHKNLFFKISEKQWKEIVTESIQRIGPKSDTPHFIAELLRVSAAIGDGHTQLAWNQAQLPMAPVRFYHFSDGVFVTLFPKGQEKLSRVKVLRLNGVPMDTVLQRLRPFIPAENEAYFNQRSMAFLAVPSLLHAFGIGDSAKELRIGFKAGGKDQEVRLVALSVQQVAKIPLASSFTKAPIFFRRAKANYTFTYLQRGKALYLSYNRCQDLRAFSKLVASLAKELETKTPQRFIIDLRRNGGGSSMVIAPLFGLLLRNKKLKKAKLFCLIGNRTFSSALLNAIALKQKFHATLVGQPTAGKPNHYGEIKQLHLKNSRLTLFYSTKFFKRVKGDPSSLVPDISIPLKSQTAFEGQDSALLYCLQEEKK